MKKDRVADSEQSVAENLQLSTALAWVGGDENGGTFAFILHGPTARDNLETAKHG